MVDNKKQVEEIEKQIKKYGRLKTYDAYCLKGKCYKDLFGITKDMSALDNAIESFTKGIDVEQNPDAYCERANLYSLKGDNDSALNDFKEASEIMKKNPNMSKLDNFYLTNHLESLSQLQGIKDTINKLKDQGIMDTEFLKSYESLTDNVMKINNRVYALEKKNEEMEKKMSEMMSKMSELTNGLIEAKNSGNNGEMEKLKSEIGVLTLKLNEVSSNVDVLMS